MRTDMESGMKSSRIAQAAAVVYVLWGLLHLQAAFMVYKLGNTLESGMVHGRMLQHAWNLLFASILAITIAVTMNWKNRRDGYWINPVLVSLVDGDPAYEAFVGIERPKSHLKVIAAIYSSPGMFAVRKDSTSQCVQDLVGKPIAWGTRASGITLLGKYVMDGLGLDREKDFEPHFLEKAGDGPEMVADGRVAAQWGAGIGWPGFNAVTNKGGRLIGLSSAGIVKVRAKQHFLKQSTVPAGSYPGQSEPVEAVGSWSFILARPSLPDETAYRLARALHYGHAKLVARVEQAAETLPTNTYAAAPSPDNIHPVVMRYLPQFGFRLVSELPR